MSKQFATTNGLAPTRRDVIVGAAGMIAAGTVMASTQTLLGAEADETPAAEPARPDVEVIDAEFLVIGGGNAALSIATQAHLEGKHVTLVDKGLFRHSGTSGMSWDAFGCSVFPEDPAADYWFGLQPTTTLNGDLWKAALAFDSDVNLRVYEINRGHYLPDRNEDGTVADYAMPGWSDSQFFRHEMDTLLTDAGTTVYDQTMITDLLVSEGQCVGAMGIHLPSGKIRAFRAPVTALATGGCTTIYGWFTVSPYSICSMDNTADVEMAAYRRGVAIGDAEYAQYDVLSCEPSGLACAFGAGVCGDAQEAGNIYGTDGELIFDPTDPRIADRVFFAQWLAKEIAENGRGTERGGVLLNVGDTQMRYANDRNIDLLRKFGIDVRTQTIEAVPEMYEHGGTPLIDETMMSVDLPGLFCVRGAGNCGAAGGTQVHFNRVYGPYLAHNAVAYADALESVPALDWAQIAVEKDRLQGILDHADDAPVRPFEVVRAIQAAGYKGLGVYRTTEAMESALADVEAIREQISHMVVSSSSPVYNREWKEAIEAYNMLDILEVSLRASLAREETRGMYLRAEFPERDDENWDCMLIVRKGEDGVSVEKQSVPALVW